MSEAYNNYICDGLVTTSDTIEAALFNTDFAGLDPTGIVYSENTEGWDTTWTSEDQDGVDAMEASTRGNEVCRLLYELNSLDDAAAGYCCQTIQADVMPEGAAEGLITSATTRTLSEEEITITAGDNSYVLSYGAELFHIPEPEDEEVTGANASVASILAIASSMMVYL
jgi:hypothetical protein